MRRNRDFFARSMATRIAAEEIAQDVLLSVNIECVAI